MSYFPYAPEDGAKYVLLGPDGSRCVFNDDVDPDACGMNSSATGLDSPDVMAATDVLVEADGGYNGNFYYGNRPITLNGTVYKFLDIPGRNIQLAKIKDASNAMLSDAALTFSPSWRIGNNVMNPSFEYGLTPWVSNSINAATISTNTGWSALGTKSGRWQATTSSGGPYTFAVLSNVPVTGNAQYNFGATLNQATTISGASVQAYVQWKDQNGVAISENVVTGSNTTGAQTFQIGTVAPVNAVTATIQIGVTCSGTYGAVDFSVDRVFLSRENLIYLDGDQAGMFWQGTPGNSGSGNFVTLYTPVRRQQPTRFSGPFAKAFQIMLTSQFAPLFSAGQVIVGPASSVNCQNYGNYPAAPVVRVYGPTSGASFTVTNSTTGQFVAVNGPSSIASGHYVDIDILNHIAYSDTGLSWNRYINFATVTWPTVTPKTTSTWTTSTGTLQVTYRHCWV